MLARFRPSWPLALLFVFFSISRLGVMLRLGRLKVDFKEWGWHLMDPALLKERLLETLFYLHAQPPLFNASMGLLLKGFPGHEAIALQVVYTGLGALLVWLLFRLMTAMGVSPGLTTLLTAAFILSPASMLFERFSSYDHINLVLMTLSAWLLYRYLAGRTLAAGLAFFSCVAALALLRPIFHLAWVVVVAGVLIGMSRPWGLGARRRVLVACLPCLLVAALYVKNAVVFHHFAASTWMGMNLARITVVQIPPDERAAMVARGELSPLAKRVPFLYLTSYPPAFTEVASTGIPVLDRPTVSTSGLPNYNHLAYIRISDGFMKDDLAVIRHHPGVYLKGVVWAFANYFRPAEEYFLLRYDVASLRPWSTLYDKAVYWRFFSPERLQAMWPAATPSKLRAYLSENLARISPSLLVGLPVLLGFGIWLVVGRGSPLREATPAVRGTLAYMVGTIGYLMLVGNGVEAGENFRFRFVVDPFYLVLFGLLLQRVVARLRSHA